MDQISMFDLLVPEPSSKLLAELPELLHKGENIYRVVLGEVEEWNVDGSFIVSCGKEYRGYWLTADSGIHGVVHDRNINIDVFKNYEKARKHAETNLSKCKFMVLNGINKYRKWEWMRELDNYLMTAEIGIVENCVFVHDWYCYNFAYPFTDENQKKKIIKDSIEKITKDFNPSHMDYKEINTDGHTDLGIRLYWSKAGKCYADYKYANFNG